MARIAPTYDPGHDSAVFWKFESGNITESVDGDTPATLPALPASPALLGFLKGTPEIDYGLNNSRGFTIGLKGASYKKKGARTPKTSFDIIITSLAFILAGQANTDANLPYFALWVVTPNKETIVLRFCKFSQRTFTFTESATGEPSELTVGAQIEAMAIEEVTPMSLTPSALASLTRALGQVFFWHDVRELLITDSAGNTNNYRDTLMSLTMTDKTNIERKGARQDWGDDKVLSRTSIDLLEHHVEASGEAKFHGRIPKALLNSVATALDWGDIVARVSTKPVLGDENGIEFTVTAANCFPSNATKAGTESSAQISSTVPFTAESITCTAVEDEEG
jgi:hypothetical protein